jgi:transcriptional regulator with XRE-family HTH domain
MLNTTITGAAPMTIADRVKQLRMEHALTQEDLAAKAGLGVATIQRIERGDPPSAATVSSIASALALSPDALTSPSKAASTEPTVGSYLPLVEITSGKRLMDLIAASSAIDFDYMEIEDETIADLLGRFYKFCQPRQDSEVPSNPSDRIRLDMEASKLLKELKANGLIVAGETYDRTAHEVLDDGDGPSMLLATWEETCLVLRVGTGGVIIDRADVEARMDKWTNTNDPRIVRPMPETTNPETTHEDWLF